MLNELYSKRFLFQDTLINFLDTQFFLDAVNPSFGFSVAYVQQGEVVAQLYDKDGKPATDRWRWETYRNGRGEELEVHLHIPDSAEWSRHIARYNVGTPRLDAKGAIRAIAKKWFDEFKGAKDADDTIKKLLGD